jgi:hypothetical protein
MQIRKKIKSLFKPRLKLVRGTRLTSFLMIAVSMLIAAGILFAANIYYDIDTGEVVVEEIQRVTNTIRATAGLIVGGTATQNPTAGYVFEAVGQTRLATTTVATGTLELTAANQELRFTGGIANYYVGFKANTSATSGQAITYTLPAAPPDPTNYVLTSNPSGVWQWQSVAGVGAGDIQAVGDCLSGSCFTGGADGGNSLWFEGATANDFEILLTAADPTADYTITLPAATGYVALGTSTANYVAYWTSTSTLAGEQYLSVSRGGTGAGSFTQYGVLYGNDTAALGVTATGTTYQLLTANAGAAPTWRNIADLTTATNGLTLTGTATTTLKLGGTLIEDTTIALGNYNMIFNMTGTGDFKVQDAGTDILVVSDDGKIYYKTYPLAETGKQVLREMIPIFGFDLPAQTATTSYTQISRVIEDYPFSATSTGTTRVHKFVIRYADATTTASTTWRVYNVTDSTTTATFQVPPTASTTLDQGEVYITGDVAIPTDTDDWRLDLYTPGTTIRVYQIFLAAYDQLQ